MSIVQKIKCFFGFHYYEDIYKDLNSGVDYRDCRRCGHEQSRKGYNNEFKDI